ncbi:MAG: DUF2232 domain-containing protein [Cohaesibacteraceae bacterium]|nr:DUF2232 domain-containing protein [Cohaesibacteraceae bacterium]
MLKPYAIVGIISGLGTAVLNLSFLSGSSVAILLVMLAPLPILIATLGWGSVSGLIAAVSAGILTAVVWQYSSGTMLPGLLIFVLIGLPAFWVGHLCGQTRKNQDNELIGYPIGRLLAWIIALAVLVNFAQLAFIGFDLEKLRDFLNTMIMNFSNSGAVPTNTPFDTEAITNAVMLILPVTTAFFWVCLQTLNVYLAALVVRSSGQLHRTWPIMRAVAMPKLAIPFVILGLFGSFFDGIPGYIGLLVTGGFFAGYLFLGLAVLHTFSRKFEQYRLILGFFYLLLMFIYPLALLIAVIGLFDQFFNFRNKINTDPVPNPNNLN